MNVFFWLYIIGFIFTLLKTLKDNESLNGIEQIIYIIELLLWPITLYKMFVASKISMTVLHIVNLMLAICMLLYTIYLIYLSIYVIMPFNSTVAVSGMIFSAFIFVICIVHILSLKK